jgi:UDP-N-acetylmuramoylalanine--D-glutamate ligase
VRLAELEAPRVGLLGAGREGQAVWRKLRELYPSKPLALFTESTLAEDFARRLDDDFDHVRTGPFDIQELSGFDVLVRSAGISPYRDDLVAVRAKGVRFTTASNIWFAENPAAQTIAVTGTLGKSTTAALTAHLLEQAGLDICLAGNIGRPMLDIERTPDWWVIELSSYQLSDLEADINIAVLLNLSEEHLDWHRGYERYRADKLRLAELARNGQVVANYADETLRQALQGFDHVNWFNRRGGWCAENACVRNGQVVKAPISLPGAHNMANLAAALTVMDLLRPGGLDVEKALHSFSGLPHRLQLLGSVEGIRYVNDSISTTPVSVAAALAALGHSDVILLLGGMDRGLDWRPFARDLIETTPYAIVTMPDNGPRIMACLEQAGVNPPAGMHSAGDLEQAVGIARRLAPPGGCVLLSPGAPSFPRFRDFQARGEQFKALAGF